MQTTKLLILFYFISTQVYGQEVITTQGDSYTNSSILFDYTIGESIVETYTSANTVLTQGFHQTLEVAYPTPNNCSTVDLMLQDEAVSTIYNASETISSSSIVKINSVVSYIAGSSILLVPGFEANIGSEFRALILDCTPNFNLNDPPSISIVNKSGPNTQVSEITSLGINPNPASDQITINFSLTKEQSIKLGIYDTTGRLLNLMDKGNLVKGNYSETLSSLELKSGTYYVTLFTEESTETQPLIIIGR